MSGYGGFNSYGGGSDYGNPGMAGGGYMSSQGYGGPSSSNRRPSSATENNEALRPVTIKLIKETAVHSGDAWRLFDKPLKSVTFVARIVSVDYQSAYIQLLLSDNTASIETKIWPDESFLPSQLEQLYVVGNWVKVFGDLTNIQNQTTVQVFRVRPITDYNEVTFHRLEVVASYLYCVRGPPPLANSTQVINSQAYQQKPFGAGTSIGGTTAFPASTMNDENSLGNPEYDRVQRVLISGGNTPGGMKIDDIIAQLPGSDPERIRYIIHQMYAEGHIYETIDNEHYKCSYV